MEYLFRLFDRIMSSWLLYRAGKNEAINEANKELLKRLEGKDEIHNRVDNDPEYRGMLDNKFVRK